MARDYPTSATFITTGLVGTVGYKVIDVLGNTLVARTTAGITEVGTFGQYVAVAPLEDAWAGYIVWDDGSGSSLSEKFAATATTAAAPVVLPATRLLTASYVSLADPSISVVSVKLSDPTNTFGARRLDTLVTVVANDTPMVNSVGSGGDPLPGQYEYEIAESGLLLEYWAEFHLSDGSIRHARFYSNPPGTHYSSETLMRARFGTTNVDVWADLDNNQNAAERAATIEAVLSRSDRRVNLKLIAAGVSMPFAAPSSEVADQVQEAATTYAMGYLIKSREDQSASNSNPNTQTPGDALIAEGDEILAALAGAGALTEDTEDGVKAGTLEFFDLRRGPCSADEYAQGLN